MLKKCARVALAVTFAVLAGQAFAKPLIEMSVFVEKDIKVTKDGHTVIKRMPAEMVNVGEVVIYTVRYRNTGDEVARNVRAKEPIPAGMVYVADSAAGNNSKISFCTGPDTGNEKSYKDPDSLMVGKLVDGTSKMVKAQPGDYSGILWVIDEVAPGQSGELSFRARVQ